MMKIMVTGGAGYIGSHTCVELLNAGHQVLVIDNLCNSSRLSLSRVEQITGKQVTFIQEDIRDGDILSKIFLQHDIHAVIHFAGLKAVGESAEIPLIYYQNNIAGTLSLLQAMDAAGVRNLVFSSSATVYGDPDSLPILESFPLLASNPYGRSKLMIEQILSDVYVSDRCWNISILRYFNPVGAHPSGLIGEDPVGMPNNLMPYLSLVAAGRLEKLSIFGGDYPTADGTGVRDFIHVVDLAKGHLCALGRLIEGSGLMIHNLGTGQGYSVLEMVKAFECVTGHEIAYQIVGRRSGDIAACYADPAKAFNELGWKADLGLEEMCRDTWRWQSANPHGYR